MSNIVVAQFSDETDPTRPAIVKYILGEAPSANPTVTEPTTLQANNDAGKAGLGNYINVTKTQAGDSIAKYETTNQESKVGTTNEFNVQTGATDTAAGSNDVRIFGKLSTIDENAATNSAQYLVKNADTGSDLALTTKADGINGKFDVKEIKLNNVQYGRVTGALDNLTQEQIAGKTYVTAPFADKNFAGNDKQTDVYFYRGLEQTSLDAMNALNNTGVYQYAGHALMYGIDNTYNGEQGSGQSNSVAFGTSGEGIGNFVQAAYDSGDRTLIGSVYNVWQKDAEKQDLTRVDLVTFKGDVEGNSVVNGTADRTYSVGEDNAAFKGSFFGDKAQELGGSFNSVTAGYDKSQWGGVFGAQQLPRTPEVPVEPPAPVEPPPLPPINKVE